MSIRPASPPQAPVSFEGATVCLHPAPRVGPCPTEVRQPTPDNSDADDLVLAARQYREFGRDSSADDPSWCDGFAGNRSCVELFRDLHRNQPELAERLAESLTRLSQPDTQFGGFTLRAELGRGAFGRVYLVQQDDLADRLVVLKVAADVWNEARTLARLQHTHIMPVYSVHALGPLSAVCMPYLGAATLEDVLHAVRGQSALPSSGGALVRTIHDRLRTTITGDDAGGGEVLLETPAIAPEEGHAGGPVMRLLQRLSYVEAVLWVATRLADGLAYAHEHGVVHRDLKPANVLLSNDGQPLLLDFHVADDVCLRGNPTAIRIGGTLPYMSPEHFASMRGEPVSVETRSDIFSLGIMLFELLTGRLPFEVGDGSAAEEFQAARAARRLPPPFLRPLNPAVSPATEAIVRKCLAPDPEDRYQSARDLQEDLDRHRENRPLRYAPNPSVRERFRKWCRRHPKLTSSGTVASVAGLAVLGLVLLLLGYVWQLAAVERREAALATWSEAQEEMKAVRFLLYTRATEPERRREGLDLARKTLGRYGVLDDAGWRNSPGMRDLPEAEREHLSRAAGEVLLLMSQAEALGVRDEGGDDQKRRLKEALKLADLAQECDPDLAGSPELWRQRAELAAMRREDEEWLRLSGVADHLAPQSARDLYWKATRLFNQGRPGEALPLLREAVRREPENFWARFVLANCYDRLGQDVRAEECYAACVSLQPDCPWPHFNRGLALLRQRESAQAVAAFDETLRLKPDLTEALVNRALAHQGAGEFDKAIDDLTAALDLGARETRLYFLRSRLREKVGDKDGASRDLDEGLKRQPVDEKSWIARGLARLGRDPKAALADFESALKVNPRSVAALQNKAHVLAEKLNRPEDALAAMEAVVKYAPESGSARSGRGIMLARLGHREEALRDAEDALLLDGSAARQYQCACIYALTSASAEDDRPRALQLLSSALRAGYGLDLLDTDTDLDPLRKLPEFRRLSAAAGAIRSP